MQILQHPKPYFCKYLPIKKQPAGGDIVYMNPSYNDHQNGFYIRVGKETISNDDRVFAIEVINPEVLGKNIHDGQVHPPTFYHASDLIARGNKVVKFYLCTDVLKKGEITYDGYEVGGLPTPENNYMHCLVVPEEPIAGFGPWYVKETYRVIGEISPSATWVKEGDRFSQEEIKFFGATDSPYGRIVSSVSLLGHCGHFH